MAAANWVCLALVLSLGVAMCSGHKVPVGRLSSMNEKSSVSVTEQGNMSSNVSMNDQAAGTNSTSTMQFDDDIIAEPPCVSGGPDIVGGFCDLVQSCNKQCCDIDQLRNMVSQLSMKVDAMLKGRPLEAMAPGSA